MRFKSSVVTKSCALLLIFSFGALEVTGAAPLGALAPPRSSAPSAPADIVSDPSAIEIPFEHVMLKEFHRGNSGKLIIHIQDAHSNLSGQTNLAGALEDLMKRYGISLVLVEGADRDVSLTEARNSAPAVDWKRAAKRFLLDGVISGEEYLNLTSDLPMTLAGIEHGDLYDQNLAAYAKLVEKRREILAYLRRARLSLERLKGRIYPKEINAFERKKSKANAGSDFGAGLDELLALAESSGVGIPLELSQVQQLKAMRETEKSIHFDKASAEQSILMSRLEAEGADLKLYVESARRTKNVQVSQYMSLKGLLDKAADKRIDASGLLELRRYLDYLKGFAELKMDVLLDELSDLEEGVYAKLLPSADAKKIHAIDRYLALLESAYSVRMSSKDFALLRANEPDFKTESWQAVMNRKLAELGYYSDIIGYQPILENARGALMDFYRLVDERDQAFTQNTLRLMDAGGQKTAFLIAGGYHTAHLSELFGQSGISFMVLAPVVEFETDHDRYEKILLGSTRNGQSVTTDTNGATPESDHLRAVAALLAAAGKGLGRFSSYGDGDAGSAARVLAASGSRIGDPPDRSPDFSRVAYGARIGSLAREFAKAAFRAIHRSSLSMILRGVGQSGDVYVKIVPPSFLEKPIGTLMMAREIHIMERIKENPKTRGLIPDFRVGVLGGASEDGVFVNGAVQEGVAELEAMLGREDADPADRSHLTSMKNRLSQTSYQGLGLAEGQSYMAINAAEGISARDYLNRLRAEWGAESVNSADDLAVQKKIAATLQSIAMALRDLHAEGIYHRDLSLDEVFIDPDTGRFTNLLDFGIAMEMVRGPDGRESESNVDPTHTMAGMQSIVGNEFKVADLGKPLYRPKRVDAQTLLYLTTRSHPAYRDLVGVLYFMQEFTNFLPDSSWLRGELGERYARYAHDQSVPVNDSMIISSRNLNADHRQFSLDQLGLWIDELELFKAGEDGQLIPSRALPLLGAYGSGALPGGDDDTSVGPNVAGSRIGEIFDMTSPESFLSQIVNRPDWIIEQFNQYTQNPEIQEDRQTYGDLVERDNDVPAIYIGDLHDNIEALYEILSVHGNDILAGKKRLVSVGDNIHPSQRRDTDTDIVDGYIRSVGVFTALAALKNIAPQYVDFVLGDHENSPLAGGNVSKGGVLQDGAHRYALQRRYGEELGDKINEAYEAVARQLPVIVKVGSVVTIHAEAPQENSLTAIDTAKTLTQKGRDRASNSTLHQMLWNRFARESPNTLMRNTLAFLRLWADATTVIAGHTPISVIEAEAMDGGLNGVEVTEGTAIFRDSKGEPKHIVLDASHGNSPGYLVIDPSHSIGSQLDATDLANRAYRRIPVRMAKPQILVSSDSDQARMRFGMSAEIIIRRNKSGVWIGDRFFSKEYIEERRGELALVIGRSASDDISLGDRSVSREHGSFRLVSVSDEFAVYYTDLRSRNGTFLNGNGNRLVAQTETPVLLPNTSDGASSGSRAADIPEIIKRINARRAMAQKPAFEVVVGEDGEPKVLGDDEDVATFTFNFVVRRAGDSTEYVLKIPGGLLYEDLPWISMQSFLNNEIYAATKIMSIQDLLRGYMPRVVEYDSAGFDTNVGEEELLRSPDLTLIDPYVLVEYIPKSTWMSAGAYIRPDGVYDPDRLQEVMTQAGEIYDILKNEAGLIYYDLRPQGDSPAMRLREDGTYQALVMDFGLLLRVKRVAASLDSTYSRSTILGVLLEGLNPQVDASLLPEADAAGTGARLTKLRLLAAGLALAALTYLSPAQAGPADLNMLGGLASHVNELPSGDVLVEAAGGGGVYELQVGEDGRVRVGEDLVAPFLDQPAVVLPTAEPASEDGDFDPKTQRAEMKLAWDMFIKSAENFEGDIGVRIWVDELAVDPRGSMRMLVALARALKSRASFEFRAATPKGNGFIAALTGPANAKLFGKGIAPGAAMVNLATPSVSGLPDGEPYRLMRGVEELPESGEIRFPNLTMEVLLALNQAILGAQLRMNPNAPVNPDYANLIWRKIGNMTLADVIRLLRETALGNTSPDMFEQAKTLILPTIQATLQKALALASNIAEWVDTAM